VAKREREIVEKEHEEAERLRSEREAHIAAEEK
jgi:hypothetical protein